MSTPATVAGQDRFALSDSHRDITDYNARRSYAYAIGEERALQRAISADAFLFLYKELVRLCKDRTYCWAGVDWLAQRLATSQGTVKRWLTQLVATGLIRRKPRPGGDTALTSIPALAAYDEHAGASRSHRGSRFDDEPLPTADVSVTHPHGTPPAEASFFVPNERITLESNDGSTLSHLTVKKLDPNHGSVGYGLGNVESSRKPDYAAGASKSPVMGRLIEAGVADPGVLQELDRTPLAEIDAICRYVAAQPNCYNPPGLIVALARSGSGAVLLRKSGTAAARRRSTRRRTTLRQSEMSAAAPGNEHGTPEAQIHPAGEWSELWSAVQTHLAERVPASEFAAWLQETHLVAYREGRAIVGVPNVFARDKLGITYGSAIAEALRTATGTSPTLEVVIDHYCR